MPKFRPPARSGFIYVLVEKGGGKKLQSETGLWQGVTTMMQDITRNPSSEYSMRKTGLMVKNTIWRVRYH